MAKVEQIYYSEQLTTDEYKVNNKYTSGDIEYIAYDCVDEDAAIKAVRSAIGQRYKDMRLTSISVSERLDEDTWRIRANYSANKSTDSIDGITRPDSTYSFDFSTATRNLKKSIRTLGSFSTEAVWKANNYKNPPNYGGLINVKYSGGKHEVEGVDVVTPQFEFSEVHYFYKKEMTTKYRQTLAGLVGCINSKSFRGYEAGEVLFLGVSGSRDGEHKDDLWALTFKFAVKLNEPESSFYGTAVGKKPGWAYAWFTDYDVSEMQSAGRTRVQKPCHLYIEQVYYAENFKKLGIGV